MVTALLVYRGETAFHKISSPWKNYCFMVIETEQNITFLQVHYHVILNVRFVCFFTISRRVGQSIKWEKVALNSIV